MNEDNNGQDAGDDLVDLLGEDELPFRYAISSYGADYPVDSLVKRLEADAVFIPSFQRVYVWSLRDASRFIESLLLGLPVPGIFLSKEDGTNKLLVIDGQQRLRSLQFFYSGVFGPTKREFALEHVQERYEGRTYASLEPEDRLHLDDSIIHATVMRQDTPSDDDSSIHHVFERLNAGGKTLYPQEIRACLYHGPFNDLLDSLNQNEDWRAVFGKPNRRLRDQEMILRFLALRFVGSEYFRPLKGFLNAYMKKNRYLSVQSADELQEAFGYTIKMARTALGDRAFRPERLMNVAVFDSVMVALSERLAAGGMGEAEIDESYERLLENVDYLEATRRNTAQEAQVEKRLRLARDAFAAI